MEVNGFNINPQSGNAGANEISISVSAVNEGIDKAVEINAVNGDKTAKMTLIHEGLREVFEPSDGEFVLADGGTFNVLKVREKKINTIRLTLYTGSFPPMIVDPETMTYPISWDYPVKSIINLKTSDGSYFITFLSGEKEYYEPARYWGSGNGELYLEAYPAEDDYYIYKVEIV